MLPSQYCSSVSSPDYRGLDWQTQFVGSAAISKGKGKLGALSAFVQREREATCGNGGFPSSHCKNFFTRSVYPAGEEEGALHLLSATEVHKKAAVPPLIRVLWKRGRLTVASTSTRVSRPSFSVILSVSFQRQ